MTRLRFVSPLALGALAASLAPAAAHVTFEPVTAAPGATVKLTLRVPHGCDGSATTALRVTLPDGVLNAKPMPKPGWTLDTREGDYDKPHTVGGKPVTRGVREIQWRGGSLPDAHYDEFSFRAALSSALAPGARLPVAVVQACERGETAWVETAAPGAPEPRFPAPVLRLAGGPAPAAAAASAPAAPQADTVRAGALVIEAPWMRATPGGATVAGGYLTVRNTGSTPDRLLGGTFERSARLEVHEMTMEGGVMRMRELGAGLVIPPGETVTLKPGGLHVMFVGLTAPVTAGEEVAGTLRFERAGEARVRFRAAAIGAATAPGAPAAAGGDADPEHKH